MTIAGKIVKPLFEVSRADLPVPAEDNETTRRLQQVVFTVTECCHTTLLHSRFDVVVPTLEAYPEELRGFAYEGAGVALAALDSLLPWRRRTRDFVSGPAARQMFAVYLGAGMSLARMRRRPEAFRTRLDDPVFGWAVLDGYGFHEGFFAHRRHVLGREVPRRLTGYARRVFDQGLGRSIWFSCGADVDRVVATIGTFGEDRRPDLWSGVGLACGYTGGVDRPAVERLRTAVPRHLSQLALGAVIAAKARQQVGNPAEHDEFACAVLCGLSSADAARLADAALRDLPPAADVPAYEVWRRRIREQLAGDNPDHPKEAVRWSSP